VSPELSIIVVLYNSADQLAECLDSICADVESEWAELLLVDNASPDASAAIGMETVPGARVLTISENRGFAGGVNVALAEARGRYMLLLNPDVVVPAGGLREMIDWMNRYPEVAVASPDMVRDGTKSEPPQAFPSIWRTLFELTRLHKLLPAPLRSRMMLGAYWDGHDTRRAGWVPGTAMFVRAEVARAVGPLSEAMFMYGEDIEWCWRIRRAGHQIGVNATIQFSHAGSTSSTLSWGAEETSRRVVAGIYSACRLMYGSVHARILATVIAIAYVIEGRSPGRSAKHRAHTDAAARAWLDAALS